MTLKFSNSGPRFYIPNKVTYICTKIHVSLTGLWKWSWLIAVLVVFGVQTISWESLFKTKAA